MNNKKSISKYMVENPTQEQLDLFYKIKESWNNGLSDKQVARLLCITLKELYATAKMGKRNKWPAPRSVRRDV